MVDTWVRAARPAEAIARPSRRGRWIATVLLIAGLVFLVLAVVSSFAVSRQIRDFQRVPAPGVGEVRFTRPGQYVIYLETPGRCCSFSVGAGAGSIGQWSLDIGLVSASSGQRVPVRSWRGPVEAYAVAGHAGQTALDFRISQPGSYILGTKHPKPRAIADVAVGPEILRGLVTPVLWFVPGLGALAAAALLFGITLHRRRRWRRTLPPSAGLTEPVPWSPAWDAPAQMAGPGYLDAPAYVDAQALSPRPSRRRAGLILGVAAVVVVGLIPLLVAVFAGGVPSRTSPVRPAARSGVAAHPAPGRTSPVRPAARHSSHPAATQPPTTTAPLTKDQRWLRGLAALRREMNDALPAGTITPRSLRLTAAILRRCPSQLADLGPPPGLYRQTRDQASRACADFAQAAIWARAAARAYTTTAPTSPAGRKLNTLLNRVDSAVNRGIQRIDDAYYGAPVIAS